MASVLTEQSTIQCAHQGAVQVTASQAKLTVGGAKVLVDGDLTGASISPACATPIPPASNKKCTLTTSVLAGLATKLTVGGKNVLLDTANGTTDGVNPAPPPTWKVQDAGQTRLTAV